MARYVEAIPEPGGDAQPWGSVSHNTCSYGWTPAMSEYVEAMLEATPSGDAQLWGLVSHHIWSAGGNA
jgi:hypothetical protein